VADHVRMNLEGQAGLLAGWLQPTRLRRACRPRSTA
jgi:hypothetical protein